jgi:predicted kinase
MGALFLLRGLPGSGKSTTAKELGCVNYEADQYFIDSEGNYNFDGSKLKDAHASCLEKTRLAMEHGIKKISVSNTFTQEWEMTEYRRIAKEFGYQVYSLIVENRHNGVNVHGVPTEKLQQMKDRFEITL